MLKILDIFVWYVCGITRYYVYIGQVQCIDLTCKLPDFKALQFLLSGGLQGECTFSWWVWLTIAVLLLCLLASVRTCSPLYHAQLLNFLADLRAVTATGCGKLHGVVIIAENNASRHFSAVSTFWLFSSDLLLYLPSLLLFVPLLLHNYRLHLLLLPLLFERILVNKLEMINVMKPAFENYTAAVQESTLTMYNSIHHLLSRGEYSLQFIKKCIFSRGNSLGNAWKNAFFPQDLKVPNIHDKI